MNISGISIAGYNKRIKSIENKIIEKWHYTPDIDLIKKLLSESITDISVITNMINYNYDLQKDIIDYLLSEDFRVDQGIFQGVGRNKVRF